MQSNSLPLHEYFETEPLGFSKEEIALLPRKFSAWSIGSTNLVLRSTMSVSTQAEYYSTQAEYTGPSWYEWWYKWWNKWWYILLIK